MLLSNHCGCVFVHRHLLLHCVSAKWRLNHMNACSNNNNNTSIQAASSWIYNIFSFFLPKKNHLHSSISILFSSWTTCRPTRHNKTLMQTQPTLTLTLTVPTVMLRSMHQVNRNLVWRNILMIGGKHLLLLAIDLSALARFGGLDSLLDKIYNLNASHDIFHYYLTFWGSFKWSTNQTRMS